MTLSKLSGSAKQTITLIFKTPFAESFDDKIAKKFESFILLEFSRHHLKQIDSEESGQCPINRYIRSSVLRWRRQRGTQTSYFLPEYSAELPPFDERKMTEIGAKNHYFCRLFPHTCAKKCSNHAKKPDDGQKCFPESGNREIGPEVPILPFHIKFTPPFETSSQSVR